MTYFASRAFARLAVLGTVSLTILPAMAAPPANDDIAGAVEVIEPLPFADAVSTVEATTAVDDPDCNGNGPSVWYVYTPSADGAVVANTFGSSYDTTLSAYTVTPGGLVQIACNDDSGGTLQSQVNINVEAGSSYYFMVGSFASGPGGDAVFTVDVGIPPVAVDVTWSQPVVVVPSTGAATAEVQVTMSAPVFLYQISVSLIQSTGRGHVIANASGFIFEQTDAYAATLGLKDQLSLKANGTGFVGGKARLRIQVVYVDPNLGFQVKISEQEVQLRGSKGK